MSGRTEGAGRVREWMSAPPVVVSPATPVLEAREVMQRWLIRHLPVTEGERLVGIVSDTDIRLNLPASTSSLTIWEINAQLARLTVGEVMSRRVVTIAPSDSVEHAAGVMLACKIRGLPVVEHGLLIGILTETDLLRAFVGAGAGGG